MVNFRHHFYSGAKFLVAGGAAAVGEYCLFLLIVPHIPLLVSQLVSFCFGMTISFSLNKYWVFKSAGGYGQEILRYVVLALINAVIGLFAMQFLVEYIHLAGWVAKLIVMTAIAIWNYFIMQRIIFKRRSA